LEKIRLELEEWLKEEGIEGKAVIDNCLCGTKEVGIKTKELSRKDVEKITNGKFKEYFYNVKPLYTPRTFEWEWENEEHYIFWVFEVEA
jgi:hypothetical protein